MKPDVKQGISKDIDDAEIMASNKEQSVLKENGIYGKRWETLHNGYFADPEVALPLIEVIKRAIKESHPTVIADLGGGTGFILKELLKCQELSNIRLVNVDISSVQLSECVDDHIIHLQASVDQLTRNQLQIDEGKILFIARSLLHYFGYSGLRPLLRNIRSQLSKGEIFVHQSACFENIKDAECLNLVYKLMGTPKWYSTVKNLKSILNDSGFNVYEIRTAAKLRLESNDLSERYQLVSKQKILIRKEIERLYGQKFEVFISSTDDFTAWLHYFIFSCKAI